MDDRNVISVKPITGEPSNFAESWDGAVKLFKAYGAVNEDPILGIAHRDINGRRSQTSFDPIDPFYPVAFPQVPSSLPTMIKNFGKLKQVTFCIWSPVAI